MTRSSLSRVFFMAVASTVTACTDELPLAPTHHFSQISAATGTDFRAVRRGGHESVTSEERAAARVIARALAIALQKSDARQHVKASLASSRTKENKLHFASFFAGRGGPLVSAAERDGGVSVAQLDEAIQLVRDLEFYMPVGVHRDQWTGDTPPLVAIALHEDDEPEAFAADGSSRMLSRTMAPQDPVLVLAPVETDFAEQVTLNLQGRAQIPCTPSATESLSAASTRCKGPSSNSDGSLPQASYQSVVDAGVVGLFATEIHLLGDYCGSECWAWGDPEYEIITHAKKHPLALVREQYACAGDANPEDERRFDLNGTTWLGMVMLLSGAQIDSALAADSGWVHTMWEDDTAPCIITANTAMTGSLALAATGAYGIHAAFKLDAELFSLFFAVLEAIVLGDFFNGGDDFVGWGMERSQTLLGNGRPGRFNVMFVSNSGTRLKGEATIRPYGSGGPYFGPVTSVVLSQQGIVFVPRGYIRNFSAFGIDGFGTPVPNRPVSWSSTNTSVATVNSSGSVSGIAVGASTITATIDGVSSSLTVEVVDIGPPVAVEVSPSSVWLETGQSSAVIARAIDSHGFEIPGSGSFEFDWHSTNPGSCDVSGTGFVHATSPGTATLSAALEDLQGTAACLVAPLGGDVEDKPDPGPIVSDERRRQPSGREIQPARTTSRKAGS